MKIYSTGNCAGLIARTFDERAKELAAVKEILAAVRERGDEAVFAYEEKFDRTVLTRETFRVTEEEFAAAERAVEP